ncbi:hypothetical protein LZQ00_05725 [Sphingobacterium sp. SRCM116780]|uniref:hypothetical protein n=1 Tax=Sphingobacterium sp. SRCM116780 TaxID=2907623 RepID=UPI001F158589|nr:hypothetical protein [Sphingobacterium sp. SRCM116780]UIR57313.1 hypothetical protein LZQ00_05725 [Sphingobacterium sp. SRCM116780]
MKKLIVLSFVALTMFSCKNKGSKTDSSNSATQKEVAVETTTPLGLGCYVFNDNKDTVSLEITSNEKEIKGNLTYSLAEKDKNSGSITGQLKDSILIADYTFQSEGTTSVRQVAFKVEGDTLIEGYGVFDPTGTTFKNVNNIDFTSKMPLIKTDCNK